MRLFLFDSQEATFRSRKEVSEAQQVSFAEHGLTGLTKFFVQFCPTLRPRRSDQVHGSDEGPGLAAAG
ncbi:hypothetical protein RRG08_004190 [Elysia crispata]|uniref:Uncharacterized protein n=1 Tax=Elysia crispata TaxID=231223 RepID=A0AAE1D6A9_9GAST|nr:hypothetical protein RRG08_004190 [Elysia crispata]